jgi:hypothetical protein
MKHRIVTALLAMFAVLGLVVAPARAASTVVQPGQTFAGAGYGEWSARWWQWAFALSGTNAFTDPSGAACGVGQSGRVWFLGGQFGQETSPTCTVPPGVGALVPVVNGECSSLEGNGATDQELADCAAGQMNAVDTTTLTARVDGQAVDATGFRFATPAFGITAVADNPFGVPPGTGRSVADGYYLLLRPLSVGRHTIDVHADLPSFGAFITTHYTLDVTR